jgi:hypothetical protein
MPTTDAHNAVLKDENVVRLISVPTEMEAGIIVGALEEHEIRAAMAGVTTANFRAEAPGLIDILIAEHDLPGATQVLKTLQAEQGDVDWSQVDVGNPEDADEAESGYEDLSPRDGLSHRLAWIVMFLCVFAFIARLVIKTLMTWNTRH